MVHVSTYVPNTNSLWHVNMKVSIVKAKGIFLPFLCRLVEDCEPYQMLQILKIMLVRCMAITYFWKVKTTKKRSIEKIKELEKVIIDNDIGVSPKIKENKLLIEQSSLEKKKDRRSVNKK